MNAGRLIRAKKEELRKANNTKFTVGDTDYRIEYDGGVAEYIAIYGRKRGGLLYRFVDGFAGYDYSTKDQVVNKAKELIKAQLHGG